MSGHVAVPNKEGIEICQKCVEHCQVCIDANRCSKCDDGLFEHEGKCVGCDLPGQFRHVDEQGVKRCSECDLSCLICGDQNTCRVCEPGYYLNNNKNCVKCDKPNEFRYRDESGAHSCSLCALHCELCADQRLCSRCDERFFLKDGMCVDCLKPGEFKTFSNRKF